MVELIPDTRFEGGQLLCIQNLLKRVCPKGAKNNSEHGKKTTAADERLSHRLM